MKNLNHLTNTDGRRFGRTHGEPLPFPSEEPIAWLESERVHCFLLWTGFAVVFIMGTI
jgi:hypothetical protein